METKYLILMGTATGLLLMAGCKKGNKTDEESVPEVVVAEAVTDSVVLHKTYPGHLEAGSSCAVVAEVSGKVLSRHYTPGEYVTRGQVLFMIESQKYRDAVEEASASLASAKSSAEYYEQQTAAMRKALEGNAVSKMEVNQSQNNLNNARAQIKSAQAQLSTAQLMLSKCTVRAPISGYITEEIIGADSYVNGEGAPVTMATIYDNATLKTVFYIENAQCEKMLADKNTPMGKKLYSQIPLKFEQNLPHNYTSDLTYESPTVSGTTGTVTLTGHVKNQDNELKDGMYVTVSLPYGVNPKAVLVREASISTDQLGKYLYVVNDSNRVVYTPVTVGELYHDSLRVIEKGIKPGERYVKDALLTVRNGMSVKPIISKSAISVKPSTKK